MTDAAARREPFDPVERESWAERVQRDLGDDPSSLVRELLDGLRVEPLYTERPLDPGEPGAPPFIRGSQARSGWEVVHSLVGEGPAAIAASSRAACASGAERLWLPRSSLDGLRDEAGLRAALGDATLPVVVEHGPLGLAWQGALDRLDVDVEPVCDPLASLARDGALPMPIADAFRSTAERLARVTDGARPALVDARVHHEAGATAVEELGAAVASGLDLLRHLGEHGHALADAPLRVRFAFAVGSDLFLEIAKLRAARLLWSKVLRALGVDGPEQGMSIHAFGSRRELSRLAPHDDLLRGTVAAFAAAVGGAERVTLAPYEPTPHGERLARNTQLVLRHESHLDRVTDAAGGSYYVEALTDRLARAAWEVLQAIESDGGMSRALTSGSWQSRVHASREARDAALRRGALPRVGVNRYPAPEPPGEAPAAPAAEATPAPEERPPKVVRDAIREGEPGALLDAIRGSDAPVAVLRAELARGREPVEAAPLEPFRDAARFEALRIRAAGLDEARRRAWIVGVGPRRALASRVARAKETLAYASFAAEVSLAEAPGEALPEGDAPPVAVAIARDEAAREALEAKLRDRGVATIWTELGDDTDRVALVEALLDAIEAGDA